MTGTLARYFGLNFLRSMVAIFLGIFAMIAAVDFVELLRHSAGDHAVPAWILAKTSFYRVPQLMERVLPFTILVAAMSSFLGLSRRLELVVARAAGISAWQFIMPAVLIALVLGALATTLYNPVAAVLQEKSKRLELEFSGGVPQSGLQNTGSGFWLRQTSDEGDAIIYAATSSLQGAQLGTVTVFSFDLAGRFVRRIEAKTAALETGFWRLDEARVFADGAPPSEHDTYRLKTPLTLTQVREKFATPESVPFWDLPAYIQTAERANLGAAGYRLQYQKLLARPFLMAAMVLLAASVSLRFFRFGGVQKMVIAGLLAGFFLYVLSKATDDLSKADLMPAILAAWLPVFVGGFTGLIVLLHQEDG